MRIFIVLLISAFYTSSIQASFFSDFVNRVKSVFSSKPTEASLNDQIEKEDSELSQQDQEESLNTEQANDADDVQKDEITENFPEVRDNTKKQNVTEEKLVQQNAENKPIVQTQSNPCFNVQQGFSNIVEKALPSVVNVATTQVLSDKEEGQEIPSLPGFSGSPFEEMFKRFLEQQQSKPRKIQAVGSGFIIHQDQENFYVVTNYHVVQDSKRIKLFMHDRTEFEGTFHSGDERTDIALIKVAKSALPQDKQNIQPLQWAHKDSFRVGDWVIAIGNAFGFNSSVTVGVLSHKGRDMVSRASNGRLSDYIDDYIQHSAQINFGNSGGCLLNTEGQVIGINTAIISPSGGNVGIGFAIPAHVAQKTIQQLLEHGRTKRGWLGVKIQPFTEEMAESMGNKELANKPIVVSITPEGPADKAGLKEKDIIVAFNDKKLDDRVRLSKLVGETEVGKKVSIKVWREDDKKEVTLTVTLGEYEDAEQKGQLDDQNTMPANKKEADKVQEILGLSFSALTNQLKERLRIQDKSLKGGIVILKVDPAKVMDVPLMRGDVIIEANQTPIDTPQKFVEIIEQAKKNNHKNLLLLITRNESEPHYITIKISEEENEEDEKISKEVKK